jgi:hypothetical protein
MKNTGKLEMDKSYKKIDFKGASGIMKFLAGSCLSGLGVVLKEPLVILCDLLNPLS